ncbi:MAG: RluA family pseudouridine synthase [Spirochaetaceae bacterium]|nr:RluA family pseudouridine synthase [Spirochaetaceae bacterium]
MDGKPGRAEDRIAPGALIQIPHLTGPSRPPEPSPGSAAPRSDPLPLILWEGAGLLFLNKPAGLLVHGPESLETQVRRYLAGKLPPSLSFRPGPLHRLDRPVSGVITFSTSLEGARTFSALLRQGGIKKRYLALVTGNPGEQAVWEDRLVRDRDQKKTFSAGDREAGAQNALTRVWTLASASGYSLAALEIATGRTHQIRSQAALHGHPLAGDRKYGGAGFPAFFLHAAALEFTGAGMPPVPKLLEAPLPPPFSRKIQELFGRKFTEIPGPYSQ